MKLDLQDLLLIAGVGSLVGGIGAWSKPAGFVVFGLICLATVFLMQRAKPVEKGVKNGSTGE